MPFQPFESPTFRVEGARSTVELGPDRVTVPYSPGAGISASRRGSDSLIDLFVFFELKDVSHLVESGIIAQPEFVSQHRSGAEKH
jgi:hypothetical protein